MKDNDKHDIISVRISKELAEEFRRKCRMRGNTQAQIIKKAIEEYVKRYL